MHSDTYVHIMALTRLYTLASHSQAHLPPYLYNDVFITCASSREVVACLHETTYLHAYTLLHHTSSLYFCYLMISRECQSFFAVQTLHHATAGEHCPKHLILLAVPHPPPPACRPPTALEHAHRRTLQTAQNSVRLTMWCPCVPICIWCDVRLWCAHAHAWLCACACAGLYGAGHLLRFVCFVCALYL